MNVLNKLKRGLAAFLSLSVAMSAVFVFHFPMMKAYAAESEHEHSVDGKGDIIKWTAWPPQNEETEDGEAVEYPELPNSAGYYYLTADVEIGEKWQPADGTYLCLNGKKITMTKKGPVVYVGANKNFTLCDCEDGGQITHSEDCLGLGVDNSGVFNMYGGAISGNNSDDDGVGVYNKGEFNMYGGKISSNTFSGSNGGGGVCNSGGKFNMYGGEISGNIANNYGRGGGVYSSGGTFNMYGGEISNNKAQGYGGGVYIRSGSFEMYDGKITGNTSDDNGGGVYNNGAMAVGGTPNITGNKSNASDSADENNVYLPNNKVITISKSNPLWGEDTLIGVTNQKTPNEDGTAIATAADGNNYRLFFSADYERYGRHASYPEDNGNVVIANVSEPTDAKPPVDPKDPKPTIPGDNNEGGEGDENDPPSTGGNPALADNHGGHDIEIWKAISTADDLEREDEDSYYYVLIQNVEISETWKPADGTVLCLNGHDLIAKGDFPVITAEGSFSLCDCEDKGRITHYGADGDAVLVNGSAFAMYSGEITGNSSGVVFGDNGGTITVGGTARILSEVYLPGGRTITIDNNKPLTEGAEIYVSTAVTPEADAPVPVTGNNGDNDYSGFFSTDNENYEFKTVNGEVVLAVKEQGTPDKDHDPHGKDDETVWEPISSEAELKAAEGGKHYYLTEHITLTEEWTPAANTYICLNGHNISGTIGNSNVTLCNCKSTGSATVTVSANNTITVGGKLKANITLNKDARIKVDGNYPLTTDGSITVTTDDKPTENVPVTITDKIDESLKSRFKSNEDYKLEYADGVLKLTYEKVEKPPVVDPPVDPTKHIHPICGDVDCRVRHNAPAEWTAWESTTSLPAVSGSYYLTDDVEISDAWTIPYGVDIELCLNGHDITLKNNGKDPVIKIDDGASLILCDCAMYPSGSNTIVNNLASAISAEYVRKQIENLGTIGGSTASGVDNDGSFMMYGGVIANNRASGVSNSSDFVMNGGVIIGNSAVNGGGVYNRGISSTSASFTMEGGVIVDNYATNVGGGLYNAGVAIIKDGRIFANSAEGEGGGVYQDGALTVDHSAYISKNKVGSSANNVFLPNGRKINIGTSLSGTVGVTLETTPTGSGKVDFATGEINSSTPNKIKSDNSSFTVKQSGGALSLYKNTSSSGSSGSGGSSTTTAHDWELDILHVDSSQIPQRDRTAIIDLLKTMPDWVVGAYYDVTLYDNGYEVDESTRLLDVEMTIPSSIRAANRAYKVIRVHDGKAAILDDIDSDPNTVTVRSRYFSTYAIIYSVSKSGAANGSSNGSSSNGGYGNPAMGVQNDIPIAGLACGFTVLALAAPGKKLEQ